MTKAASTTAPAFAGFSLESFSPEAMLKSFGGFGDMATEAKQNVEAVSASVAVASKGAEALRDEAVAYCQSSYESIVAQANALKGVSTPQEAIALQLAFGKTAVETFLKQANVNSELFATTLRESARPISDRAALAMGKLQPQA